MENQKTFFCEKCNKDVRIPKNLINKPNFTERARAKHNHQQHALILGIKFKIYPHKDEVYKLNVYFDEYAKAVTFAARVIDRLTTPFLKYFLGKKSKDDGKWIFPVDKCDFCVEKKEISYRNKSGKKICNSCYLLEFGENGIRKKIYATRGRKVNPNYNIFNTTNKLSGTHYNYVVREAFQLLDALKKQRAKRIRRLSKERSRLRQFEEMLEQEDKRYSLPLKQRQRERRFIHISQRERVSELKGYTLKKIRDKIKILRRNIEREQKSLNKKSPISFKGNRIMLSPSVKFDEKNSIVRFTISNDLPKEYKFSGLYVANKRGREYFKEKLDQIRKNKPKYAYLLRKQVNKNNSSLIYEYYLQYTTEIIPEIKSDYNGVIGIDRGSNPNLAVIVFLEGSEKKPSFVKFFKEGKEIVKLKIKRRKQLYFLKGKHNKRKKLKKIRQIEPGINQILHTKAKEIISLAKEKKAVISLEKLEKIKKSKFKQRKMERYRFSLFNFKTLSDFIDYKARKEGIKVVYVDPEMTSQTCSHCHSVDTQRPYKKTYSLFKCNSCGIELNADYNAAFNIAQKGLKTLNP